MAIGMALAYPSFNGVIRSNRIATSTNNVIAALNLARTEAIRSNRGAGVCPSSTGTSCNGSDWNVGYLAYTDLDGSGDWTAGDTALRYIEANNQLGLTAAAGAGESGTGTISQVAFDRSGRVTQAVDLSLKLTGCKTGQDYQRRIVIRRSGQARMAKETCQ
ncbi:GspH/FimT family pseudopilin [Lysobacter sp. S4-A87]|uniref:GspH/FimT family protein n=1 Tax=Lysobacter sp. S4-A87 TaxID=2925843 RepID=UPI001F531C29|nr:GspH/FimT family pseudopilin [Lysobacter sp. S4-A87]UNK50598.1 GspH/FimT family pseudopilin [Lysobacter sp. S4-A87]